MTDKYLDLDDPIDLITDLNTDDQSEERVKINKITASIIHLGKCMVNYFLKMT